MATVSEWALDPNITFLNHGSFGATPRAVLEAQTELRLRIESNPVRFFAFDLDELLTEARVAAAGFVGADPAGFAFVTNATTGANVLLRSAPIHPGDEILLTDHGYEAVNLASEHIAAERGASIRFVTLPDPAEDGSELRAAILGAVTARTRLAVIDHVTSPTALVLPVAEIVAELAERGVETIIDGAHAPGQVDLDVDAIGAAGYTANWHKWTCSPKGAGFLWVRPDWRKSVMPVVISHGAGEPGGSDARFRAMFDWLGTADPTPYLCVPAALERVGGMLAGGWPSIRLRNRAVALEWRRRLMDELGMEPVAGEPLVGSMVSLRVPERWRPPGTPGEAGRALQRRLDSEHGVVIAAATRRGSDDVLIRISAHLHTPPEALDRLIGALQSL